MKSIQERSRRLQGHLQASFLVALEGGLLLLFLLLIFDFGSGEFSRRIGLAILRGTP